MDKLYLLYSVIPVTYRDKTFDDTKVYWFVDQRQTPPIDCAGYMEAPNTSEGIDHYAFDALQEYFREEEAAQFLDWLRDNEKSEVTLEEAELPIPNDLIGFSAIPAGGGTDFIEIYRSKDYNLPFKVVGYYSLW